MSKRIICIILTLLLVASIGTVNVFSAAADNDNSKDPAPANTKLEAALAAVGDDVFSPDSDEVADDMIAQADQLPDSIDLRDYNGKNYVTPVKFQNPFGTCWAFGIAGASEISFLYENDMGVPAGEENNYVDFSEKYITWYMYHGITEDDVVVGGVRASQVGEGFDPSEAEQTDKNAVYSFGGSTSYASNFFASGNGPVYEDYEIDDFYPFYYAGLNRWRQNDRTLEESEEVAAMRKAYFKESYRANVNDYIKDGYIESADEYDRWFDENWGEGFFLYTKSYSRSNYAGFDDWTLPLNARYRFPGLAAYFKNSYVLPEISGKDSEGNYKFQEIGLAAMKLELSKGHGISIGYLADQSKPGQELGDEGYMNTTNWAQYYNDIKISNHAVTIVGYDDNYPKENFTRTAKGEVVEGSTPPGDGAFIVKNSWGALTEEDKATVTYDIDGNPVYVSPDANDWGYESSGYFYLSYYDHSISHPETFEFYKRDKAEYTSVNYDQYDLLQAGQYADLSVPTEVKMANVFDAEEDEILTQISYMSTNPMTTVHYAVYKDVEDGDPCSGVLLEEGENTNLLGGYQRFDLQKKYFLHKGEKYAVVITHQHTSSQGEVYDMLFSYVLNAHPGSTVTGIINEGESYFYGEGVWDDMADDDNKAEFVNYIYNLMCTSMGGEENFLKLFPGGKDGIAIDNFPIKAFLVPADVYGFKYLLGDADCDNDITIVDATVIQRTLVSLPNPIFDQKLADCDGDDVLTIFDATAVQRYLADMPCPQGVGKPYPSESAAAGN